MVTDSKSTSSKEQIHLARQELLNLNANRILNELIADGAAFNNETCRMAQAIAADQLAEQEGIIADNQESADLVGS